MSTKIEWCDAVFNPIWGCRNNCPYCYARKMAKRFAITMHRKNYDYHKGIGDYSNEEHRKVYVKAKNFTPQWLESNFQKKFPKKPKRIFMNSMSDINFWRPEWMERVLEKVKQYPQHTFMFLTKFPEVYTRYDFLKENIWRGITVESQEMVDKRFPQRFRYYTWMQRPGKTFLSIEPLLGDITDIPYCDWVIVGAETGNRKNKVVPDMEYFGNIYYKCWEKKIPYFEKDSIQAITGRKPIREFPK